MDEDLRELGDLVVQALAIADRLRLWDVGISLDTARVDLTRLAGEPAEHVTLQ